MLYPRPTKSNLLWVVIPVVAGISLAIVVVVVIVFRRKRSPVKQPMDSGQLMTPLMSGFEMQNASVIVPSDPVELRRMNFQTPGMLSHPPINVQVCTDKKENQIFLIYSYKEIQNGTVARSYMTNDLLIDGEIFAHFLIY
jgi:hypothetical protein